MFGALAVLLAITLLVFENSYLLVGWLWFLGTLVPMIGLVQVGWEAGANSLWLLCSCWEFFMIVCWAVGRLAAESASPAPR